MAIVCLPSYRERIADRTRRVRDGWSQSERDRRRRIGARKFREWIALLSKSGADRDHWAAGAMAAVDLQRLAS